MSVTTGVEYAGFWRRTAAALIDTLLLLGLALILELLLDGAVPFEKSPDAEQPGFWRDMLMDYLLPLGLTLFFWVQLLGTPGKLLLQCRIADTHTGRPLSNQQAALRYIGYFLSAIPLLLGFLWIAWDKRKQGFHDKLANAVVVMEDEANKPLAELLRELR